MTSQQKPVLRLYPDGSARDATPGGWAVAVVPPDGSIQETGGFDPGPTTNQRMEIKGGIEALRIAQKYPEYRIEVYTDSKFFWRGYTERWVRNWQRNGWKKQDGTDVKNIDLWAELESLRLPNVTIYHMRGHTDASGKEGLKRRQQNFEKYGEASLIHNRFNCLADKIAGWCRVNQAPINRTSDGNWVEPTKPDTSPVQKKRIVSTTPIDPNSFLQEFRSSAISDDLTLVNAEWAEGDTAVETLAEHAIAKAQRVTSYATKPTQRILRRYEFAASGGWIAYGVTLDGERGEVAYFKPKKPRIDFEKRKLIKYETPAGCEALPILPAVTWKAGLKIAKHKNLEGEYTQRLVEAGINPDCLSEVDHGFWRWWKSVGGDVAIAEGLKKSLASISNCLPAIALRGITCWHKKGSQELHEVIAHFATPGRTVYIIFDQDEKPKTQRDVRSQILKLGAVLETAGCKVMVPCWGSSLGKGIDDALFSQGQKAQVWFDELLRNAPSLNDYKRHGRLAAALEMIARLNQLSYPAERETEGEYLPELPELQQGSIHALLGSMDCGKTYRIGRDWVKAAIDKGWNVLVLSPINSLGRQTAKSWGLPHIHSVGKDAERTLWEEARRQRGVVLCPDSLGRLPRWFFSQPLLLILDEGNQVVGHTSKGETMGDRHEDVLEYVTEVCRHAASSGAIVISEDGLPDRAVDKVKKLSGIETVRVFKHRKQGKPWDCTMFRGHASGYRARLLQALKDGKRILVVSSSQKETKRLEDAIKKRVARGCKVVRIDSETNEGGAFNAFFDSPDTWLEANQPDVLILSPSAKSGVSIQGNVAAEDAYFSEVWGYFPALATDTHMQLLGRYRPSVPRFIHCPDFILGSGDESLFNPRAIERRLRLNGKALTGVYGLGELMDADDQRGELMVTIETAVLEYLAIETAVAGCQKSIAFDALMNRLEQAGHRVKVEKLGKDKETAELWKQIQEEIWRKDAAAIAGSVINPDEHTQSWARKTLDSMEVSLETRILARKVLWRNEFPGIDFDNAEDCYQALCQDYGSMARGVQLQARAENLEASKESDRAAAEFILQGKIRAFHRLPKGYTRSLLIAKTGVLALLNGEQYSNSDPRAIAVKSEALKWANEIRYWLRLDIKPEQTPVEIAHKLLRKLGLELDREDRPGAIQMIARPGKRSEKRDKVYRVDLSYNSVRVRLLEAAQRKLSESVSLICNKDQKPHIQIEDTAEKPNTSHWFTPESLQDVQQWWAESAGNPQVEADIRGMVPAEVLRLAIGPEVAA